MSAGEGGRKIWERWKRQVLGVFVLFHLLAIGTGSLPVLVDERGLDREAWRDPLVQGEFAHWAARLERWGWRVSREQVEEAVWGVAGVVLRWQRRLSAPFAGYYRWLGTGQRWRMFPAAVEQPWRFQVEVEVEVDGEREWRWQPVYRMGWDGEGWNGRYFDRDRFRAALNLYGWGISPEGYEDLVGWLEVEVARDFPEARRFRVGFAPVEVMGWEGRWRVAEEGWKQERVVELARPGRAR